MLRLRRLDGCRRRDVQELDHSDGVDSVGIDVPPDPDPDDAEVEMQKESEGFSLASFSSEP